MDDKQLDKLLADAAPPAPDAGLMGRVMVDFQAAQTRVSWRNLGAILWPFGPLWQPLSARALVAVMGAGFAPVEQSQDAILLAQADFSTLVLGEAYDDNFDLGDME